MELNSKNIGKFVEIGWDIQGHNVFRIIAIENLNGSNCYVVKNAYTKKTEYYQLSQEYIDSREMVLFNE